MSSLINYKDRDKPNKKTLLVKIEDVPQYLRFNPFILTGYRPPELTSKQCVYSLCYWHNETVNIITHVISMFLFAMMVPKYIPWDQIHSPMMAYFHVISSFSSWVGSSIYHLFMNHQRGENFYFNLLRWDVAGIWVTQSFGAFTTIYTSLYFYPQWLQTTFSIIYILLALRALRDVIMAKSAWERILGFAYLGLMRLLAFMLRIYAIPSGTASPLIHVIMQEGWPLLGSLISATRVPERWFPGKFDFFLNSHNLMHVFVVFGAVHMHWATCADLIWASGLSEQSKSALLSA